MNTQDIPQSLSTKLLHQVTLEEQIASLRSEGSRLGFTNGVFDILHRGHVTYLAQAASIVDRLIVGVNSDASVKRLGKGDDRPINPEDSRALVLSALESVSHVVIFENDTPLELINTIRPDVLIKGGDYDSECMDEDHGHYIVGAKEVRSYNGLVATIPIVEGYSTTRIIERSRKDGN